MTNFQRTAAWLKACGKTPSPEALSLQVGCHIEECLELLRSMEFKGETVDLEVVTAAVRVLDEVADDLKSGALQARFHDPIAGLDAICDSEVTGNGIAYLAGFDKDGADQAVLASNEAKLVDGKPVLKPGGKIGKPEGWKAPDLTPFV